MPHTENRKLYFGINNCLDLYDKLKFEHSRLVDTQYKDKYVVFNFVVTAYHLHDDWLNNDRASRPKFACKKRDNAPQEMRLLAQAIKDLANGNKHMLLDDASLRNKAIDVIHPPEIRSSFYSWCNGPHFGVSIGATYYSFPTLADLLMSYFVWIFDDSILANEFPVGISEVIARAAEFDSAQ